MKHKPTIDSLETQLRRLREITAGAQPPNYTKAHGKHTKAWAELVLQTNSEWLMLLVHKLHMHVTLGPCMPNLHQPNGSGRSAVFIIRKVCRGGRGGEILPHMVPNKCTPNNQIHIKWNQSHKLTLKERWNPVTSVILFWTIFASIRRKEGGFDLG